MKNLSLINLKFELENIYVYPQQIQHTIQLLEVANLFNVNLVGICDYNEQFSFLEEFLRFHPRGISQSLFIENDAKDVVKYYNATYEDKLIRYHYQPILKYQHQQWIDEYACIIGIYEKIDNKWRKIR